MSDRMGWCLTCDIESEGDRLWIATMLMWANQCGLDKKQFGEIEYKEDAIIVPCKKETTEEFIEKTELIISLEDLIIEALYCDGGHHKQWYLEQIAETIGMELLYDDIEEGIAP